MAGISHTVVLILGGARSGKVILIDCLTLWLSNLMHHERNIAEKPYGSPQR